jgi:hypothetical protein
MSEGSAKAGSADMMGMSGPKHKSFTEGWALPAWSWNVAHYYRRKGLSMAWPVCSRAPEKPAGDLFEPGDFPLCTLCRNKMRLRRR